MNKDLRTYLKVYKNWIPLNICEETTKELKEIDSEFQTHVFYDANNDSYHSNDHELSIAWYNTKHKDFLMKKIWEGLQQYLDDFQFDWFFSWQGYSEIRFNRYHPNTQMELHCDHIHSIFDGQRKGIPTLTVLGGLNDDYKGGELVFWQDTSIEMKAGEIMIFPSCFLYPHKVNAVTEGTRYSYVSWAW